MDLLIIEDEPMIVNGISFLLKEYKYPNNEVPNICIAQDGEEANQCLNKQSFDFIFTDIKMPKMNGLELVKKWTQQKSITQWVIISGFNDFEYAQEALKNGVKDYLLKPVTKKKMNETIDRLMKNRNELINSFVSITQSQDIIEELEDSIWMLNEDRVSQQFINWTCKLPHQSIDVLIYQKSLEEILLLLVTRLREKGIQELREDDFTVIGHTKKELDAAFMNRCLEIMNSIRLRRKGNIIDPIDAAKEYIQSHLGERLSLADVADKLGFNPTYFSQLFKKETGESFVAFRRKIRMEWAKQLIEQNEMRIIDISNEIGYSDLAHFTKSFKKYTGVTPSEYKQQLGITS
ncbi:AraC family transcriptional regulator [Gracilibacillus salitolerans]|uniref:AraC family transcriptional regulator n=1 Tax=Gracilibacillus salitolerans TaxID=2663022 RepID=A0A5Q2TNA4_9BACI|nr:AraC family transcriptional regulator [Gracilibacillus salitolerans]QGH35572.1 AraC family transcriptional regulator [Gracilibacillus salitolerans]